MIARRFEDLVVWQLSEQLKNGVYAIIERPPARRDLKYCDQIRESARSATRNIAEGFGRFYPKEFGRYLRIAGGSLSETVNHLHDGLACGYLTSAEHEAFTRIAFRALKANTRLQAYLAQAAPPSTPWRPEAAPEARNRAGEEGLAKSENPSEPEEPREPREPVEPREPREPI